MRHVALVCLLAFILAGCDYYDNRLSVVNHSQRPICPEAFEDTIPDFPTLNQPEAYLSHIVLPGDSTSLTRVGTNGWPFSVQRSTNRKLNLFVYNADSVRQYHSMDSLNRQRRFHRISLSLAELEARHWRVVVP